MQFEYNMDYKMTTITESNKCTLDDVSIQGDHHYTGESYEIKHHNNTDYIILRPPSLMALGDSVEKVYISLPREQVALNTFNLHTPHTLSLPLSPPLPSLVASSSPSSSSSTLSSSSLSLSKPYNYPLSSISLLTASCLSPLVSVSGFSVISLASFLVGFVVSLVSLERGTFLYHCINIFRETKTR